MDADKQPPKQKPMFKLGTKVKDNATGLEGMLIHMQIMLDGARFYSFQPRGLNPETSQPIKRLWLQPSRVLDAVEIPDPELPLQILGTQVEDIASGFKGTATAITLHINGCVHVAVQPSGAQSKSGAAIEDHDFDIRLLKGDAVPVMAESEKEESRKTSPSPEFVDRCGPRII